MRNFISNFKNNFKSISYIIYCVVLCLILVTIACVALLVTVAPFGVESLAMITPNFIITIIVSDIICLVLFTAVYTLIPQKVKSSVKKFVDTYSYDRVQVRVEPIED